MALHKVGSPDTQLKQLLSRTDWGEILRLLEKKSYQRKFQIIEAFTELAATKGVHLATHSEIARKCKITRQLVDHHFPDSSSLITLSYRYIYAGFQKRAADGLLARSGFLNQLKGYIDSVIAWVEDERHEARFLVQFYAFLQLSPQFAGIQERNLRIGQERLVSLCLGARNEGFFQSVTKEILQQRVSSVQTYILGFITLHAWKDASSLPPDAKRELWRCILATLELGTR